MEIRQLRYLIAVAQEANFTRAAEKVFVSQSALSQQVQALENEVGAVLFERSKRGVRLTAAGDILYAHAQRVMAELEQAETALRELEGLGRGELRVGVVQTVNDYLMPTLAAAFSGAHPGVKLSVEELSSDEIEARLERGELQVGLGFTPATTPHIAARPLFEEPLVLIVRDDHPLAALREVEVSALDTLPVVMLSNTFCTRRLWEENARLAHAQPKIVMEMNTVSSILAVVEKTGLATVLPKPTLVLGRAGRLVSIDLRQPSPSRHVGLLWPRDAYLCAATRAFIGLVEEIAAPMGV